MFDDHEYITQKQWDHRTVDDEGLVLADIRDLVDGALMPIVCCSVVPRVTQILRSHLQRGGYGHMVEVRPESGPMPIAYRTPETLVADRYCVALAARELYGSPVIVIDCGTAMTVNVVGVDGSFIGGSISPGLGTSLRIMHEKGAQLPALVPRANPPVLGRDTAESMYSGVVQLARHGLEGMLRSIKEITGPDTPVLLTGGDAELLQESSFVGVEIKDEKILLRGLIFYLLLVSD